MAQLIDYKRAALQLLTDLRFAGLTHLSQPANVSDSTGSVVLEQSTESIIEQTATLTQVAIHESNAETGESGLARKKGIKIRNEELAEVAVKVAACTRCQELASTRTQTVFGIGNPQARVMFIGEAPGADEDATGEPFVGKAGKLLTKIIEACGWTREEIYICNILRCRPPDNRNPTPEEASNCREYLDAQIKIVAPEYIVCWGTIAAQNLLGSTEAIGKLRSTFFEHGTVKVLCTYHPSYLLRNPSAKKPVWEDMQLLLKEMGLKPPQV